MTAPSISATLGPRSSPELPPCVSSSSTVVASCTGHLSAAATAASYALALLAGRAGRTGRAGRAVRAGRAGRAVALSRLPRRAFRRPSRAAAPL